MAEKSRAGANAWVAGVKSVDYDDLRYKRLGIDFRFGAAAPHADFIAAHLSQRFHGLPGLPFRTLEKRLHFCREEVRLNRRLADRIYDGVVAVTESGGGLTLEGDGKPVEYAVKMQRLEDRCTMGRRLGSGSLDTSDLEHLAARLSDFYHSVPTGERTGGWGTVRENCEENFRQMEPFVGVVVSPPRYKFIRAATREFITRRRTLFQNRIAEGSVREGHGDLRSEHVYFTPEGIQIIDCIEFNQRMRYNDVASDIAFLIMDLDHRGAFRAAEEMLSAFVCRFGDLRMLSLTDFYCCYRACVRLKVTCFRLQQESLGTYQRSLLLERARDLAALAGRYAERFARPTLYVVMGMIAAGKSILSRALGQALDIEVISSDRVRKELFRDDFGSNPARAFGEGRYRPEARSMVYAKILLRAQEQLRDRRSVVLDASFSLREHREETMRLAEDTGAAVAFIECTSPEDTIRDRLRQREDGASPSDARLSILQEFQNHYQPPEEIPESARIRADTTRPPVTVVAEVFIASRKIHRNGLAQ